MSLNNFFENKVGNVILGIEPAGPALIQYGVTPGPRYLALLNTAVDNYPPYDPMNPPSGPEGSDPEIERLAMVLGLSTELQDANYERQAVTFEPVNDGPSGLAIPGRFQNSNEVLFPAASAPYEVTHFALTTSTKANQDDQTDSFNAGDDGRVLIWGSFTLQYDMQTYQPIPISVPAGDQLKIPAGGLTIWLS